MFVTIAKQFTFDAAHRLATCPPDHKCYRLHGHTYGVEIQMRGPVGPDGFVVDYERIADRWQPIHEELDHQYLNEVEGLELTSTEHLVHYIFERMLHGWPEGVQLLRVRVSESSTTWAEMAAGAR
jgi:6-pyruvoyltetrahydropterin/6-carboxytetrahydropterin synthase